MESSGIWRERWIARRNRVLSSPDFQRFAARFWLTRPIAKARARGLFDLVAGFTYSQILAACVETKLLEIIGNGALDAAKIAARIDLQEAGAERLLRGAAALNLVQRVGARWMLGSDGAALLGNPGIAAMVAHHHLLYADLADPIGLLRRGGGGGALSALWPYAESAGQPDAPAVAAYSALMAASQPLVADMVIDAYPFARHQRLLDVGGGEGVFLQALLRRAPGVALGLFDLPAVIDRADGRLGERVALHGGSFLTDPLPRGYDAISLVRVLHDHDDAQAMILLRAARAALEPGGTVIVAEPMAQTRGAEPSGDAYFGFYLLAMGSGRPRPIDEIESMLRDAGFGRVRRYSTAIPQSVRVVSATA